MSTETTRAAFEASCIQHAEEAGYEGYARLERDGDGYADPHTQAAWWGWREALQPTTQSLETSDDIDIKDVREYLDAWGCLAHPGVVALLNWYGQQFTAPKGWKLVPVEPDENQWGNLARDIIKAWDFDMKRPRELFKFLEYSGTDIPQWLRDEPEMKNLDHMPSKGTRAVLIYKAMLEAAPKFGEEE